MFLTRDDRYKYCLYRRNRRRRQFAFFLLVVLLLLAAAGLRHHHPARHAGHHKHSAPARTTAPHSRAKARRTSHAALADAGTGLRWSSFHGIALPASAQDGPRHTDGGLAWGFSDTPRGALLAAINIAVRTAAQWGPAIYGPTIRGQVTSPAKAALLSNDSSDYAALRAAAQVRHGQPAGRSYAAEVAYRFAAWAPATATVEVMTEGPGTIGGTVLAVTRIHLVWLRGDWRVTAPPGGEWASSATTASSLAGYTAFPEER